ncbi:MAG: triose-phosphate isomerase [Desulfosudaceae bacterium]
MSQRTPLIAGNWKMFKTSREARETAAALAARVKPDSSREVMIAPQFTALLPVKEALADSPIFLGAQNLHWESEGAYTGEISAAMLTDVGCDYVIIGHSERRQYFHETDESVNRKIAAALGAGLIPVLCIGESEADRDAEKTFSVLDKQIRNGLQGFDLNQVEKLVIAYEPVWAIGTGKTATSDQAQEAHAFIRRTMAGLFGEDMAEKLRILYGGSVKPANIAELMSMSDIDGALVGGASLEAESFSAIIDY